MYPDGLKKVEEDFGIRNGAWTREAVSYLGLSFPLKKGWKESLMSEGIPKHAPILNGISVQDHKWACGKDIDNYELRIEESAHSIARQKDQHLYVMSQLDALESVANDLRQQADDFRAKVREMRKLISEDDF